MLLYILRIHFTLNPGAGGSAGKQRPGSPVTCGVPVGAEEPDAQGGGLWGWGAIGGALGRRSAFLPAPTRRVQRPFVATFRDASEAPGTAGGKGRGGEGSPRPGPARAVAFCSPAPAESSSQNSTSLSPLLHVGKHLFRAGKDSESPPASFSNLPPASSYSRLLREGAELEEGAANVLLFTHARRLGSPAAPSPPSPSRPHAHPRGHHMLSSGPCGRRKLFPNVQDSNTPRVCSSALSAAALSLQTRVVPDPKYHLTRSRATLCRYENRTKK